MKETAVLLFFAVALLQAPLASASHLPSPVGFVSDFAGILPDAGLIETTLAEYEVNTTIEVAVVTIGSLPEDQTTATYVVELFQEWGIGKEGEDNGILILIVKDGEPGNRMRIELGYGIQGYVTGAESGRILDNALPFYEQGDYQSVVITILGELSDELVDYEPGARTQPDFFDDNLWLIVVLIFFAVMVAVAVMAASAGGGCPYCDSRNVDCSGDSCVCRSCGKRFKKRRSGGFVFVPVGFGGGRGHGGGGGFGGGFGGGGSGGGGAGR